MHTRRRGWNQRAAICLLCHRVNVYASDAASALKETDMRAYLQISGTLFGLVAVAHALRVIQKWPIEVAGWAVPVWASVLGFLLTGALAAWAFSSIRQAKR